MSNPKISVSCKIHNTVLPVVSFFSESEDREIVLEVEPCPRCQADVMNQFRGEIASEDRNKGIGVGRLIAH